MLCDINTSLSFFCWGEKESKQTAFISIMGTKTKQKMIKVQEIGIKEGEGYIYITLPPCSKKKIPLHKPYLLQSYFPSNYILVSFVVVVVDC